MAGRAQKQLLPPRSAGTHGLSLTSCRSRDQKAVRGMGSWSQGKFRPKARLAPGRTHSSCCLFEIEIKLEVLTECHSAGLQITAAQGFTGMWQAAAGVGAVTCGSCCDLRLLSGCLWPGARGKEQPLESMGFRDSRKVR